MVLCFSLSLLIFCLVVLVIAERGMLKPPTIIMGLSVSPFSFIGFFKKNYFGAYTFIISMSS